MIKEIIDLGKDVGVLRELMEGPTQKNTSCIYNTKASK